MSDGGRGQVLGVTVTRTRALVGVLVAVVLVGALGWIGGSRIASPAELAARAEPPEPSLITVAVERRTLSADIVTRGDIGFADPVSVSPVGATGEPDARQVVTRLPEEGAELVEGSVAGEVAGRPVLMLQGPLPAYRDLRPGATGSDVAQLEAALVRLGHLASADETWTADTGAAVQSLYAAAGYVPNAADDSEEEALTAARARVRAATTALRDLESGESSPRSLILQARADRDAARESVAIAQLQADRDDAAAEGAVDAARAAVDAAASASALADARLAQAEAGTSPDTGEPATPVEVTALAAEAAGARAALTDARNVLSDAERAVALTARQGQSAVAAAQRQVEVSEAALAEAAGPAPGAGAGARDDAVLELREANEELAELTATTGTWLPAGEVVYVPQTPVQVASVDTELGAVISGSLITVSGTSTAMRVSLRRADLTRIEVGDEVLVDEPDLAEPLRGTVSLLPDGSAGSAAGAGGTAGSSDDGGGDSAGGGGDDRVTVEVALDELPEDLVGANVRVVIPVESTAGDVLVVPASALSAVADGDVRVQVEDPAAEGGARFVTVETGLASDGDVEVRPLDGELAEGDRVVVGLEGIDDEGIDNEGLDDEGTDESDTAEDDGSDDVGSGDDESESG